LRALLAITACAGCAPLQGQGAAKDALSAVEQAMFFRRSALADSLRFDACSVYERTGQPGRMADRIRPGLRSLLDSSVGRPCMEADSATAAARAGQRVRVDSVVTTDSTAEVHLHVRRGGWRYTETYYLAARPGNDGWSLREVRMSPPLHTTPPPRHQP
jgi:hypothetical protein